MISDEIAAKFYLPHITKYHHETRDWYSTFLTQSDYIVSKAMEAQLTGDEMPEDYADIMAARAECRKAINAIDAGTYDGEEAMTELEEEEPGPAENVIGFEYRDGQLVQVEGDPVDASAIPAEVASLISGLS